LLNQDNEKEILSSFKQSFASDNPFNTPSTNQLFKPNRSQYQEPNARKCFSDYHNGSPVPDFDDVFVGQFASTVNKKKNSVKFGQESIKKISSSIKKRLTY
jgi:hypothetical protein